MRPQAGRSYTLQCPSQSQAAQAVPCKDSLWVDKSVPASDAGCTPAKRSPRWRRSLRWRPSPGAMREAFRPPQAQLTGQALLADFMAACPAASGRTLHQLTL